MYPQFDFNIKHDGKSLLVYPLEEKQLVYLAQTTGLSKFNMFFSWYEVSDTWLLHAIRHGWIFCRSF